MSDPFAEGKDAALAGWSEDANPYDLFENEEAHMLWHDGWEAGMENDDG